MFWLWISINACILFVCEATESRIVDLDDGAVQGNKYWNGNYLEFYGIPYASAPTGRDKYKPPLPVKKRDSILQTNNQLISCQQTFYTGEDEEELFLNGEEQCLTLNIFVPLIANETNLVPVVVYIHSGAYAGGNGNMGKLQYLVRHDIIAVSFNYRVGAIGFACLGTEDIPGNAALKDQLAALKWIHRNIRKFGGDPDRVTLAGYSVGATMAELQALSKQTDGLFNKLILESGSALTPFAINRHPISTATNIAISLGYNATGDINDLNEFYLNAPILDLVQKSLNFFLTNSTFGFAPCIERTENNPQAFLTESPLDIFKKGDMKNLAIITGFSNMEGLSRAGKFDDWKQQIKDNFKAFIPADLNFKDDTTKTKVAKEIYEHYFKDDHINKEAYVNYFSDSMFKYGILKSAKLHFAISKKPLYLYEFSYVGELNIKHVFMGTIKGASHRDQSAYILDFLGYTSSYSDMDTRDRMTYFWSDFIKYENPTAYESSLTKIKWLKYSSDNPYYMSINNTLELKTDLSEDVYQFWDKIYDKYYWKPTSV